LEITITDLGLFHRVKLPKSFVAINLSEISPQLFGPVRKNSTGSMFGAELEEVSTSMREELGLEEDNRGVDEDGKEVETEEEKEIEMVEEPDGGLMVDSTGNGVEV
jgi:hypothetical protein